MLGASTSFEDGVETTFRTMRPDQYLVVVAMLGVATPLACPAEYELELEVAPVVPALAPGNGFAGPNPRAGRDR